MQQTLPSSLQRRREAALPLGFSSMTRAFLSQPWSFKLTCIYVFFEYVRPQQVYESLQILPWAQISIVGAILAFFAERRALSSRTIANALMVCMAVLVVLSSILAYSPSDSFARLNIFGNWLVAFFLISNTVTDQRKFFLFVVLFLLWSTKMSQFAARSFIFGGGSAGGAPGWFQNTGEFALQMCIYVPLSFYFVVGLYPVLSRFQLLLLSLLPVCGILGIMNSSSRGGVLGLACVGLWILFRSRHKVRGLLVLGLLVPAVWVTIPEAQRERFKTAGEDETSVSRIAYWKAGFEMAQSHPILGVGYENWVPYYHDHYFGRDGAPVRWSAPGQPIIEVSHNSFIEVWSQLGYTGLGLFAGILGAIWYLNCQSRRLLKQLGERGRFLSQLSHGLDAGVLGFIVAGFFMAVAFNPFVWFQLAMTASLNVSARRLLNSRLDRSATRAIRNAPNKILQPKFGAPVDHFLAGS